MDFITGRSGFSWNAVLKTSPLSVHVQQHVAAVYRTLGVMLLCATVGSFLHIKFHVGGVMTTLALLAAVLWMAFTPKYEVVKRTALLHTIAFLEGVSVGFHLDHALNFEGGEALIATAFLGTTVVFATFSAAALFSPRRSLLYLGGVITALLATMTILMLVNLFLWSQVVSDVRLYLGIFAFSLFVCFDTQMIVEKAEAGDHDVPSHALELFLDFVNLFVRLLRALQKKSEKKKSKD